jgi:hypothetical protein
MVVSEQGNKGVLNEDIQRDWGEGLGHSRSRATKWFRNVLHISYKSMLIPDPDFFSSLRLCRF